jgi:hypothetical protein
VAKVFGRTTSHPAGEDGRIRNDARTEIGVKCPGGGVMAMIKLGTRVNADGGFPVRTAAALALLHNLTLTFSDLRDGPRRAAAVLPAGADCWPRRLQRDGVRNRHGHRPDAFCLGTQGLALDPPSTVPPHQ